MRKVGWQMSVRSRLEAWLTKVEIGDRYTAASGLEASCGYASGVLLDGIVPDAKSGCVVVCVCVPRCVAPRVMPESGRRTLRNPQAISARRLSFRTVHIAHHTSLCDHPI